MPFNPRITTLICVIPVALMDLIERLAAAIQP